MNTKADALIAAARDLLKRRYEKEGHHVVVAAALLTTSGRIYAGLHVGTTQPSIATCAEIITIGMAHTAEEHMEIDMIVAVRDPSAYIIAPCGKCREYIADYGPNARVVMPDETAEAGYKIVPVADLLPDKYCKKTCAC